jgi:hypothetical protein
VVRVIMSAGWLCRAWFAPVKPVRSFSEVVLEASMTELVDRSHCAQGLAFSCILVEHVPPFGSDADRVTRLGLVVGGSLGSLIPDDYQSDTLPLWRLHHRKEKPLRSGKPT